MPLPSVQPRVGRRAISIPTPPPAYQQTIHIPLVYMPSVPTTPQRIPLIIPRTCSPAHASAHLLPRIGHDYVQPNGTLLPTFTQHQGSGMGTRACNDVNVNGFYMPSLDPLVFPSSTVNPGLLFKSPTGSYANSSAHSSPLSSHYTPMALETPHTGVDAWQAQTSLPMFDPTPQIPISVEYQPHTWATAPDLWVNGGTTVFNEDFDINTIPPIDEVKGGCP